MPHDLARRLRAGTARSHRAAERSALIRALLRGAADPITYAALVRGLLAVYTALEAALERRRDHPVVGALHLPALWRRGALRRDLAYLTRETCPEDHSSTPAVAAYVARIHELESRAPELLVAHAYVRYLGDLAGGRILGAVIGRALGLAPGRGLDFYDFPAVADPAAAAADFRRRLDDLPVDDATVERLVAEADRAFGHNLAVFAELEGSALAGALRLALGRGAPPRTAPPAPAPT